MDPLGYPDGANRFLAFRGSPLMYVDPSGLSSEGPSTQGGPRRPWPGARPTPPEVPDVPEAPIAVDVSPIEQVRAPEWLKTQDGRPYLKVLLRVYVFKAGTTRPARGVPMELLTDPATPDVALLPTLFSPDGANPQPVQKTDFDGQYSFVLIITGPSHTVVTVRPPNGNASTLPVNPKR